jgi:simple sugar transport system substrate-binding protein/ribose transport system substrate-binding protein
VFSVCRARLQAHSTRKNQGDKHVQTQHAGRWAARLGALALGLGLAGSALAQSKGLDEPFREGYKKALAGKTVGYAPVAMGFDLAQGWYRA